MRKIIYLLVFLFLSNLQAQQPEKLNAAEIYQKIQSLNFLGSVLYIAAHPDDENTRLISYLSNKVHARTAYLSITRGDGGQNLIGPELGPLLGIIRTQELLAARRIDGGHQLFTRANDFGYSKHPEETLQIWNKEEVLGDVVHAIRRFRPDVIINRFDHTTAGETHGHHTTSAILSVEAFKIAGNPERFPHQLQYVQAWQPQKLFHNTSPWFYENQEAFNAVKPQFQEIETGTYFPMLGMSNTEIASLSRSQHQSQGFGSTGTRGESHDYLELIDGQHPTGSDDLFAGINTSWSRLKGGEKLEKLLSRVEENFNFKNPSASVPDLLKAYQLIQELEEEHWKQVKSEEVKQIIAACSGLFLEAVAANPLATKGESLKLDLEAINRSDLRISLASVTMQPSQQKLNPQAALPNNQVWQEEMELTVPINADYTTPYWLNTEGSLGMYAVEQPALIGLPETPDTFKAVFELLINGTPLSFEKPIIYKTTDPVKGEVYQPFEVVPELSARIREQVIIFADAAPQNIPVILSSRKANTEGRLRLQIPEGWVASPESHNFQLQKGEEKTFIFTLTPPKEQSEGSITPIAESGGNSFSKELLNITYDHIPVQTVLLPSAPQVVKLDIKKNGEHIGYIQGAGDLVPQSLRQIGYRVTEIDPRNISETYLSRFDAVVLGIRAYNTVEELPQKQADLLAYVKNGGNLIVQYNTSQQLQIPNLAPYPLNIGRDRVTDENAPVHFLAPDHQLLNHPNKITPEDFTGWVQERGLYFPRTWGPEFTPILSMNDPGEGALHGSLLAAPYGKGNYIYTGLSFFRELPAGVPGAYKLFANLVSMQPNIAEPETSPSN